VGSVCSQYVDDGPAIGRQLACSAGILSAYCHHTKLCLQRVKREHNRRFVQGSMVLCLLILGGQAFASLLSEGIGRRLRLSAGASRPIPPDYPPTVLMSFQI
jgi:hypothetical protein